MTARLFAATTLLFAATTLSAQPYKYLVSVATFKVPPTNQHAFVEKGKVFVPVLDKLMASGSVLAYGIDTDILHVPGETNVAFWVVVPNYAALDKEGAAIDEFIAANPGVMQELTAMSDPAAHHDLIIRTREESHKSVPPGSTPIGDFDMVRVKPGHMQEFMELFRKYDKPVYEKLVTDGVIYAYELDTEAVHTMEPGLMWTIVTMPNLAAKDKVNAAFEEADKNLPEAERNMFQKLYLDVVVPGSHRDSLSISQVYKAK
jgi:hypothetical protein